MTIISYFQLEIQQDVDSDAPYILKSDRWKQKVNNSKNKKFAEAAEFARWTKSYETEVTSFDSMALFAEVRYTLFPRHCCYHIYNLAALERYSLYERALQWSD